MIGFLLCVLAVVAGTVLITVGSTIGGFVAVFAGAVGLVAYAWDRGAR